MRLAPMLFSLCASLSACTSLPPAPAIEGTSWHLLRFESPDDAAPILRPGDPQAYTLSFGQDGRLAARLDCNRGSGPWQAAAADAKGGSLRIGPLASTRALCPPDPIGKRLPPARRTPVYQPAGRCRNLCLGADRTMSARRHANPDRA